MTRETKDGLPVLSEEVINTFDRDILRRYKEIPKYNPEADYIKRIAKENPVLFKLMNEILERQKSSPSLDFVIAFVNGMVTAYELLRRQAEVNNLEELSG